MIVLTRGGGSFEDLLPFSDERLVRAVAACPVPVVSAVGHEQDTPLCDLAADVRASTPTMAGRLVVPELVELSGRLERAREALARGVDARSSATRSDSAAPRERLRAAPRLALERERRRVERAHERLRRAPALAVERKRAALEATAGKLARCRRGRHSSEGTRSSGRTRSSYRVERRRRARRARRRQLAEGGFGARVEDAE